MCKTDFGLADSRDCTGCGACAVSCPRSAIVMRQDDEGFYRPEIVLNKCVKCGACVRNCPVQKEWDRVSPMVCYASRVNDEELRLRSSSGGVFGELAINVLDNGGVVCGCVYDGAAREVRHVLIGEREELGPLLGSKYVQSQAWNVFREVVAHVRRGRHVLFAGTPCQVAALRSLLGGDAENLLTVALICHGTPSVGLLEKLIEEAERMTHDRLTGISFRNKKFSWRRFSIEMRFVEHEPVYQDMWTGSYMFAFNHDLAHRNSCYRCSFRDGRSGADIVLGDFWGVEHAVPEMDDNNGVSAVLIYTQKGRVAFDGVSAQKKVVAFDDIARKNANLVRDSVRPPERRRFYRLLQRHDLIWFKERFERDPLWKRLLRPGYKFMKRYLLGGAR